MNQPTGKTLPGRRRIASWLVPAFAVGSGIVVWEALFRSKMLDLTFFPPPSQFIGTLLQDKFQVSAGLERADVGQAVILSLIRVIAGLALAFTLALATGILVHKSRIARLAVTPLIQLVAPIAPLAWVPLAIILFGASEKSAVFIVFLGTYPALSIAAAHAMEQVPVDLLEVASTLGARGARLWAFVKLRSILPSVFLMLRLNLMAAWMALLAGETVSFRSGLGGVVIIGRESVSPNMVMSGVALIAMIGFAMNQSLLFLEKRLFVEQRILARRSEFLS